MEAFKEGRSDPADVRKWWRKWMVKLQRHRAGENLIFGDISELSDLGRFLPRSGEDGDLALGEPAAKRAAVATALGQHFRNRWQSTSFKEQKSKLGTAAWQSGLDRPVGNLAMPGAEMDSERLRTMGVRYINAASIPPLVETGHELPLPHYIATQHPMPSTVCDFWRMVLAERPAIIVMLNGYDYARVGDGNASEACAQYWLPEELPAGTDIILEEIGLQRAETNCSDDVVVRALRVSACGETHVVRHIFVSWWKDQECPTVETFVPFWHVLNGMILDASSGGDAAPKTVVHCAGGIGRVGVLIAVDMCARMACCKSASLRFKLFGVTSREEVAASPDVAIAYLRSRRVNMIQSEEQYLFLHYAIDLIATRLSMNGSVDSAAAEACPAPALPPATAESPSQINDGVALAAAAPSLAPSDCASKNGTMRVQGGYTS